MRWKLGRNLRYLGRAEDAAMQFRRADALALVGDLAGACQHLRESARLEPGGLSAAAVDQ